MPRCKQIILAVQKKLVTALMMTIAVYTIYIHIDIGYMYVYVNVNLHIYIYIFPKLALVNGLLSVLESGLDKTDDSASRDSAKLVVHLWAELMVL